MIPQRGKKAKTSKRGLGFNQQQILCIMKDLSAGENLRDVSYCGGAVSGTKRCLSVGRECTLIYNTPWEVIDLRHAGKLFWLSEHQRLGTNVHKTFNRAVHSLISRGIILHVSLKTVFSGERDMPNGSRLRFVRLVDYA